MRALVFAALLLVACDDDAPAPPPRFELALDVTGAARDALRATAVLFSPFRDAAGVPLRASDGTAIVGPCGLTFIDRHRAITAAHCVPASSFADTDPISAQFIDIDDTVTWRNAATISGKFPNWTHGTIDKGYFVTSFTCRILRRCSEGLFECPPGAENVDVAVLACDLPEDRMPIDLAPANAPTSAGPVAMFWYREIYDVPTSEPLATDFFDHYTSLTESEAGNYHYLAGKNQLLPVMPKAFEDGSSPSRLGEEFGFAWSDLYSCHGTSGSGVLQLGPSGRYQLLGPTSQGRFFDLCADPRLARGTKNVGYPPPAKVHAVVDPP